MSPLQLGANRSLTNHRLSALHIKRLILCLRAQPTISWVYPEIIKSIAIKQFIHSRLYHYHWPTIGGPDRSLHTIPSSNYLHTLQSVNRAGTPTVRHRGDITPTYRGRIDKRHHLQWQLLDLIPLLSSLHVLPPHAWRGVHEHGLAR